MNWLYESPHWCLGLQLINLVRIALTSPKDTSVISKDEWWLAVDSRTPMSSHLGLVGWACMHSRVDIHCGTLTEYRSIQTPLCYPFDYRVHIAISLWNAVKFIRIICLNWLIKVNLVYLVDLSIYSMLILPCLMCSHFNISTQ